ncbi:hypothetical protein RN001_002301 [Aquatica leii]|uniref:THAP-type domain-containing protein n=1 Tax=Aquatica leii TaxID=1421715 RepID=A0AAN7PD83_9COLE|nr:hypothetical protein RN001_002301 [Aquatica leii]
MAEEAKRTETVETDARLFRKWIEFVQRADLENMDIHKVRSNYRVCDNHFAPEYKIGDEYFSQSGLITGAVPTLNRSSNLKSDNTAPAVASEENAVVIATVQPQYDPEAIAGPSHENNERMDFQQSEIFVPSVATENTKINVGSRRAITKRIDFLKLVDVRRVTQLTPKSKKMSLKFDNLSTEEFDTYWKACRQFRMAKIKTMDSTASILDKWPFYKTPSGFRLIDMDFDALYTTGDGLLSKWENKRVHILQFLTSENNVKGVLDYTQKHEVDESIKTIIDYVKLKNILQSILILLSGYTTSDINI